MIQGKKYKNEDIIYILFKKHYCPHCKMKLSTKKVKKIINYNSPEAQNYDFWIGPTGDKKLVTGDMEFCWKEFECPNCKTHFTVDEMQKIEGVYCESTKYSLEQDKKWKIKCVVIFGVVFIFVYAIYYLIKFVL